MAKKRKKRPKKKVEAAELNIMPFIDIFSMLNTFLLVSAAFMGIGILEVQIPFFSSAPPDKSKPTRSLQVNVDVDRTKVQLTSKFTLPPVDQKVEPYNLDEAGLESFHQRLLNLRQANPESDLVTVFSEDDVSYDNLVKVVDAIKILKETDPKLTETDSETGVVKESEFLYKKVVMGSVVL